MDIYTSPCSRSIVRILTVLVLLTPPGVAAQPGGGASSPVTLRLMTFNAWVSATNVTDGYEKTLSAISESGADIVGMQETGGALATALALDLGWFAYQGPGSVALLSRFPISELFPLTSGDAGLGARIRIHSNPVQDVIVWVCHLTAFPYGPYSACLDGLGPSQVLNDETQSGRVQQISNILNDMGPFLEDADSIPVFLMGDFNTPSHLDWTPAASALHCGYAIEWPVTLKIEDAGMADSYRDLHPDPVADPGNTWSPIFETFTYPDGTPEPLDRIDRIHLAGSGITTLSSDVFLVEPISQFPDVADNEWPSDHAAVVSTFEVLLGGGEDLPLPTLALDDKNYMTGDSIVATFANGPGNSTDWIGLYRATDTPGAQSVQALSWWYTNNTQTAHGQFGLTQGQVVFDGSSAPVWPLPGGSYRAFFFCCDGYTVLAGPVDFRVSGPPGEPPPAPTLLLDRTTYASGATIVATFANGPGNATDWIGIYGATDTPGVQPSTTWFYTNNRQRVSGQSGPTEGQVVFGDRSAPVWPLPPGNYKALFLCCDGHSILAGPIPFTVSP
jgi:endonuclease/exonuclease/phosphatase family protein